MNKSKIDNETIFIAPEIVFDYKNSTISHASTNLSAKISPTSSRLLYTLFMNQGCTVSRKNLFESAYQPYGLIESNNSLNQYISLLRKAINEIGGDGESVILTIPKEGFMLRGYSSTLVFKSTLSKDKKLIKKVSILITRAKNISQVLFFCWH